jgi:ABC-type antimicrobial peptide transport system permease subunit
MLFSEILRVALDAVRVNKMRSLLTMLGIVIGVGAVITVIALGNGAQKSVQERIAKLGTTLLQVSAQPVRQSGGETTTLKKLIHSGGGVVRSRRPDAMVEIEAVMRRAHQLKTDDQDDFLIRNQADFLTTLGETTQTFTLLLAGIAAVSLLVDGIGIMNIMLVSVTERTREIGIRKALGAMHANILLQFLTEAVVLCSIGGVLGILAGIGAAAELHYTWGWNTSVDPSSIGLAFAFSAVVGLLFGVSPAQRAAAMDPIVALRFE